MTAKSKQIHVEGLDLVQANVQKIIRENWKDAKKGLLAESTEIMQEAVRQTPHEFGTLRRSHSIDETEDTKTNYELMLSFNTEYAAAVHENLEAHHPKGKAKYLEDPLMARIDDIPKNIAKRIRRGMTV